MSFSITERLPAYTSFTDAPPNYDGEKALEDFNALTHAQKTRLATEIAVAASSVEAVQEFKKSAVAAATAVEAIDSLFINLTAKFIALGNAQEFVDGFAEIKQTFREVVGESHELAVTTSQYAKSFDEVIVKFCADDTITVEERIVKINQFIDRATEIKKSSQRMEDRFHVLKSTFAEFVRTFSTWAKDQEEKDEKSIKDIYAVIEKLDKELNDIDISIDAISAGLGATLAVTGIFAVLFPPAAPWIIGVGLTLSGLQLGTVVGLMIAKNILINEKRQNEDKIKDLEDKISKIKAARTQLEQDGQTALMIFTTNISAIQTIWTRVVNDATTIKSWLQEGANDAEYPAYMKASLKEGVRVYRVMGEYLKDYADGVTEPADKK